MPATLPGAAGTATPARAPATQRPAVPALTGLRFVAASWVVMFHSRLGIILAAHGMPRTGEVMLHGSLAVTLFFLLSGFVLSYNYRQRLHTLQAKRQFWEARLARIWPVYLFSLIAITVVTRGAAVPHDWRLATATVFMIQGWLPDRPGLAGVWNMVIWTLSVEAFFYLLMPFLQAWVDRCSRRTLWLLLSAVVGLAVAGDVSTKGLESFGYPGPLNLLPLPVVKLPEFFAGGLIANLLLTGETTSWLRQHRSGALTWIGLVTALLVLGSGNLRMTLILGPFLLLILGLVVEKTAVSRLLGSRLLVFGGAISYSMYLLQIAVKEGTRPLLASVGVHSDTVGLLAVPVLLVAVSIPTYLFLEEPARRGIRRLFALRAAHH